MLFTTIYKHFKPSVSDCQRYKAPEAPVGTGHKIKDASEEAPMADDTTFSLVPFLICLLAVCFQKPFQENEVAVSFSTQFGQDITDPKPVQNC